MGSKLVNQMLAGLFEQAGFAAGDIKELTEAAEKQAALTQANKMLEGSLGFSAIKQELFPLGIPTSGEWFTQHYVSDYTDPTTGAVRRANGVYVDPNGDPSTGVFYPPGDDELAGSPAWLEKASKEWNPKQIAQWRGKLRKLGYNVEKKGGFTVGLREGLNQFYRNRYFFGKDMSLGELGEQGPEAADKITPMEAYDPIEMRQDVREAYATMFEGDEPSEAEEEFWVGVMKKSNRKALAAHPDNPAHSQLKAKEVFADRFLEESEAEFAIESQSRADENTEMADGFISLAQLISGG